VKTRISSRNSADLWPIVLLLFAVVVPALCLVWFMANAMRNESLAVRQQLADAYRSQLASSQQRLERFWNEAITEVENIARTNPAPAAFARCVRAGLVESAIILDEQGQILYPGSPSNFAPPASEAESDWAEASQLEFLRRDFVGAAERYDALAKKVTNATIAARALQAKARCLVQAGQKNGAIQVINESLGQTRFRQAVDRQGRLIVANCELMALELIEDRSSPIFQAIAGRLEQRLNDYDTPALSASQRRFLMKQLHALTSIQFPTLAAEELAARFAEERSILERGSFLRRTSETNLWQFTTSDHRVLALIRSDNLAATLKAALVPENLPAETQMALLPPGAQNNMALLSVAAGPNFPDWRLTLSLKDEKLLDVATRHQTAIYSWTAILVLGAVAVLTLLAVRLLRRQISLARLKNDLAATVSHELKTPLAAMRVLVDTLLDTKELPAQTVREYLQLIAQENERLSRLIHNFLAFSRMEQSKHTFHLVKVSASDIVNAAVESVRERFQTPGCHFEVEVDDDLPMIRGDGDALAMALINLLDNAHKFTEEIKHIILRVRAESGSIVFSVHDNGIGIAPQERTRIFQDFYQVDQGLSRKRSGCGLGLGIVQFIIAGHGGTVSVKSDLGGGSTFIISLPAMTRDATLPEHAIA
jgi:signal transduction histidine kinase